MDQQDLSSSGLLNFASANGTANFTLLFNPGKCCETHRTRPGMRKWEDFGKYILTAVLHNYTELKS